MKIQLTMVEARIFLDWARDRDDAETYGPVTRTMSDQYDQLIDAYAARLVSCNRGAREREIEMMYKELGSDKELAKDIVTEIIDSAEMQFSVDLHYAAEGVLGDEEE